MLMDYKGNVTVKIDGIAASAASVIAMARNKVLMSPVSMLMIHNPMTIAMGDSAEMQKAIEMLSEVKESIMNAYEIKTGMSRAKISHLMDAETWMNANKAVELGFADGILAREEPMEEQYAIRVGNFKRYAIFGCICVYFRVAFPISCDKTLLRLEVGCVILTKPLTEFVAGQANSHILVGGVIPSLLERAILGSRLDGKALLSCCYDTAAVRQHDAVFLIAEFLIVLHKKPPLSIVRNGGHHSCKRA